MFISEKLEFTQAVMREEPDAVYSPGMMLVAPLSEENADRVDCIISELENRLGVDLWTPHKDIMIGRILKRQYSEPEADDDGRYERSLVLVAQALRTMADDISPFGTSFDRASASPDAIIIQATRSTEPIAELRTRFLETMDRVDATHASIKGINFVHTTIGRYTVSGLLLSEVRRVTDEVVNNREGVLPIRQIINHLVIVAEPTSYVLVPRVSVPLHGNDG